MLRTGKQKSNPNTQSEPLIARRRFLTTGLGACTLMAMPLSFSLAHASLPQLSERKLSFLNLHTGEKTQSVYWAEGTYISDGLQAINKVLRDHRTGEIYHIDHDLLDLLSLLQSKMDTNQAYHVISGYRSPKTNAILAGQSGGVAKRSLHMQGKAIDIRLPGHALNNLHTAAISLKTGGVGYYPKSDFIHVDTGRTRNWAG